MADQIGFLQQAATGCFFERAETRTQLSEQLFQKCDSVSFELWNLQIKDVLPMEGGTKLMVFPQDKSCPIDTDAILNLLAPMTPEIVISYEDPIKYIIN
jgi:hypothetical protein